MHTQILTSKYGGELISFKLNGEEKIHQGEDCLDENGKVYWKRHSPVLFPIVGKLKRNQTIINARTYEMFQHGFARDLEFEPVTKLNNFHSYILRSNKNTLTRYPFNFELYTTYRIFENKLTTMYKVINTGNANMPFCIGGHPAFKVDAEAFKKGDYYLEFEENEDKIHFLYLVDGLIGTDYAKNIIVDRKRIPLNKDSFNSDAIIMKGMTSTKISLMRKSTGKRVLRMDFSEFPYLAVWSKPGAPFVCIEPWHGMSDSIKSSGIFAEKTSIVSLRPKESFDCKYTVEFFDD
ncbi:MAG: aldose 1-epimerase family protein [Clostridia bacterium]|nr:aldose 1-epimerase family protein [Clostridia bacterium]